MTDARGLLRRLVAAFPAQEVNEHTLILMAEKLADVPYAKLKTAVEEHIESGKFFPSIADIRARLPKRPGKDDAKWLPGERPIDPEWHEKASSVERQMASEKNDARFEAVQRARGKPVLASHFMDLDAVLAKHGLDANGREFR